MLCRSTIGASRVVECQGMVFLSLTVIAEVRKLPQIGRAGRLPSAERTESTWLARFTGRFTNLLSPDASGPRVFKEARYARS